MSIQLYYRSILFIFYYMALGILTINEFDTISLTPIGADVRKIKFELN